MKEIRGKTLKEWKKYSEKDCSEIPIRTRKYIVCLEERIKQLTLKDVVVAERTLNCNHEWINNTHRKTKYCRKGCAGFDEIGI